MEGNDPCPLCGALSAVRAKLVLIDEAWEPAPCKDARAFFFADLRIGDVVPTELRGEPLEQFIEGFYCDRCGKAFVSERILQGERWRAGGPDVAPNEE